MITKYKMNSDDRVTITCDCSAMSEWIYTGYALMHMVGWQCYVCNNELINRDLLDVVFILHPDCDFLNYLKDMIPNA